MVFVINYLCNLPNFRSNYEKTLFKKKKKKNKFIHTISCLKFQDHHIKITNYTNLQIHHHNQFKTKHNKLILSLNKNSPETHKQSAVNGSSSNSNSSITGGRLRSNDIVLFSADLTSPDTSSTTVDDESQLLRQSPSS
ncbi:hypothetical protein Hanom_Chr12g01165081 [Helianthus anomalus]